jgi:hypothetical protein
MAGSRTLKLSILADVDDLKKKLDTGSNEVEGFGGKLEKFGKVAAAAFAAAAAAAAAYAGKLAIEGVKAAIEDEAAQTRLATALQNVTGATTAQIAAIEQQILKTSLATGVADDQLRPALQRLATATSDTKNAQELLNLALDISASKNISVEAAANALAKAYDGNYGALAKLGVEMTASEMKAAGFQATVVSLSDTFGGAATTQANTFEGQIARLKVAFDEAKETVGAALLPALRNLLDYFVNTLIPKFQEAKKAAIDPIVTAFKNNEQAMRDLWDFTKTFLVPIFEGALMGAIKGVGAAIGGIVNIVATVTNTVKSLANGVIASINTIIRAYNAIPILPNISTIPTIATTSTAMTGSIPTSSLPFGGTSVGGVTSSQTVVTPTITAPTITGAAPGTAPKVVTGVMPIFPTGGPAGNGITGKSGFDPAGFRANENAGLVINVNAPSAIDEEGFTRAVIMALNNSEARSGSGATQLQVL